MFCDTLFIFRRPLPVSNPMRVLRMCLEDERNLAKEPEKVKKKNEVVTSAQVVITSRTSNYFSVVCLHIFIHRADNVVASTFHTLAISHCDFRKCEFRMAVHTHQSRSLRFARLRASSGILNYYWHSFAHKPASVETKQNKLETVFEEQSSFLNS